MEATGPTLYHHQQHIPLRPPIFTRASQKSKNATRPVHSSVSGMTIRTVKKGGRRLDPTLSSSRALLFINCDVVAIRFEEDRVGGGGSVQIVTIDQTSRTTVLRCTFVDQRTRGRCSNLPLVRHHEHKNRDAASHVCMLSSPGETRLRAPRKDLR